MDNDHLTPEKSGSISPTSNIDIIDWQKVGKIYKPESAIEHIINKEMDRLKSAFNS